MPKGKFTSTGDFDLGGHHLLDWRHLSDIPQSGAVNGQALVWDEVGGSWSPGAATGTAGIVPFDYIDFNLLLTAPERREGRIFYDPFLQALTLYPAGSEVTQTLGHEIFATVFNDNVSDIPNGAVVVTDPTGPFGAVHLALASDPVRAVGTAGIATELIEVATQGLVTVVGAVRDVDTSLWPINTILYLSDTVPGGLTDTPPESPSYMITVGLVLTQHATEGVIYVRVSDHGNEQGINKFFNGAMLEQGDTLVTSDGSAITLTLSRADAELDLSLVYDETLYSFVVPASVELTEGTDVVPVENWVYIPESTKVLTVSIASFPDEQHVPVARVLCQSASSAETDGVYKHHRYQDHLADAANQGHLNDVNVWIRNQHATWISGGVPNLDIQTGASPDDVYFSMTSGVALQLHENEFPAIDTDVDDHLLVVNDPTTPYTKVTNLNITNIGVDSDDVSLSGTRYSLVIIACVNSDDTVTMLCNLPSGSYGSDTDAINDPDNTANYSLPDTFRGTGILIARIVLRHAVAGGGTHTQIALEDLRGNLIGAVAGGGGGGGAQFSDDSFRILDDVDPTKIVAFEASAISASTTRTYTLPDVSDTLAVTGDFANFKKFNLNFIIDGGGAVVGTGIYGVVRIPDACTLVSVSALADQSGTASCEVYVTTFAGYTANFTDMSGGNDINLLGAIKFTNSSLSGWTTAYSAGDIVRFQLVDTAVPLANIEWVAYTLTFERTL